MLLGRRCALTAITTITRTRVRPTAITGLAGSQVVSSLAPDRGTAVGDRAGVGVIGVEGTMDAQVGAGGTTDAGLKAGASVVEGSPDVGRLEDSMAGAGSTVGEDSTVVVGSTEVEASTVAGVDRTGCLAK